MLFKRDERERERKRERGFITETLCMCVCERERCEEVEGYGMMECSLMCLYETLFIFQVGFSRVSDGCE